MSPRAYQARIAGDAPRAETAIPADTVQGAIVWTAECRREPSVRSTDPRILNTGVLHHADEHSFPGTAAKDRCLLARRQLPVGRADLSVRQPAVEGTLEARARQAHAARTLGYDAGPELYLRSPESRHQEVRSGHDLHVGAWA